MTRSARACCLFLAIAGFEAVASAQAAVAPGSTRPLVLHYRDPDRVLGHHPFLLGRDLLVTNIGAAINVTPEHVGEPLRVPFGLTFAARENLVLALHSREGVCLTGSRHGCAHVFNQLGADLLYAPVQGYDSGLALRLGFSFASFDPAWPRVAVGMPIQVSVARDLLLFRFEPGLEWGLTHTEDNAAVFVLPARLLFLPEFPLHPYVGGGFQAAWSGIGKRYVIPLVLGLVFPPPAHGFEIRIEVTMAADAGSEMPEANRRIFYDSAATIPLAIYDGSFLVNLRLYGDAFKWRRVVREPIKEHEEPRDTDEPQIHLL